MKRKLCILFLLAALLVSAAGCADGKKPTKKPEGSLIGHLPYFTFYHLSDFYLYAEKMEMDESKYIQPPSVWPTAKTVPFITKLVKVETLLPELGSGEFLFENAVVGEFQFYKYELSLGVSVFIGYKDTAFGEEYTLEGGDQDTFRIVRLNGAVSAVRFRCDEDLYVTLWLPTDDAGREQIMSSSVAALKDLLSSDPAVVRARATEIAKGIGVTVYPNRGLGKK